MNTYYRWVEDACPAEQDYTLAHKILLDMAKNDSTFRLSNEWSRDISKMARNRKSNENERPEINWKTVKWVRYDLLSEDRAAIRKLLQSGDFDIVGHMGAELRDGTHIKITHNASDGFKTTATFWVGTGTHGHYCGTTATGTILGGVLAALLYKVHNVRLQSTDENLYTGDEDGFA